MNYADYHYERELAKMDMKQNACSLTGGLGAILMTMGIFFCINPAMNLMHTGALCFAIGLSLVAETIIFMLDYPKVQKVGGPGVALFGLTMFVMGILYMLYTTVHPLACLFTMAFGEIILIYKLMPEKERISRAERKKLTEDAIKNNKDN